MNAWRRTPSKGFAVSAGIRPTPPAIASTKKSTTWRILSGDADINAMSLGGLELGGLNMVGVKSGEDKFEEPWKQVVRRRSKGEPRGVLGYLCPVGHACDHGGGCHKFTEGYEEVKVTADSGAVDHVAPRTLAKGTPVRETKASKMGVRYIAANGSEIRNEGEKCIKGFTEGGTPLSMTWQIAGVKKPLASVGRVCDAGNVAIFTDKGGYIIGGKNAKEIMEMAHKCRENKLEMHRENGVYNFKVKVPAAKMETGKANWGNRFAALADFEEWDKCEESDKHFQRQGSR